MGEAAKLEAATAQLGANGWLYIPVLGGRKIIVQWGLLTGDSTYTIKFPIAFPGGGLSMVAMAHTTDSADVNMVTMTNGFIRDKSSAYVVCGRTVNGVQQLFERSVYWLAIGY
ncbi:gp53-like domain-containing protein [Escherichia coli]|uniref:gp53-like domain-containing protein n=1 Tax=Escherichia coli TaxID=562 RepID=UPI0037DDEFC5